MEINGLTASAIEGGGLPVGQAGRNATLSREDFMKILTEQLKSQNPLDPMDNTEFINQLVSINNLEQVNVLASSLNTLQDKMQLLFGVSFIGKYVEGLSDTGARVSGKVESVIKDSDGIFLKIGSAYVPVNTVSVIKEAENGVDQGA